MSTPPHPLPLLCIQDVTLTNYRGFEALKLSLDPGLTVLYGENGAGKSNVLRALATLLAGLWPRALLDLAPDDAHEAVVQQSLARQGAWPVRVEATLQLGGVEYVLHRELNSPGGHTTNVGLKGVRTAFATLCTQKDLAWPVIAWYGTERLHNRVRDVGRKRPTLDRRTDGWIDCLDPRSSEERLLQWWFEASLPKFQGLPAPAFESMSRLLGDVGGRPDRDGKADPLASVASVEMELPAGLPVLRLAGGGALRWDQLSDGYHVFLGLVGDLARRAWILNGGVLADPLAEAEGVVLIDELDLHLHPRWQAVVVENLRKVFPRMQFVLTTHSPFVLASATNDQVRRLSNGVLAADQARVHGRDPNSVLQQVQGTALHHGWAKERLTKIVAMIDAGETASARQALASLESEWGPEDAELVRLATWLGWEE